MRIADLAASESLKPEPVAQKSPVTSAYSESNLKDSEISAGTDLAEVSSVASNAIRSITASESRLSELRQRVRDGSYQVDPNQLGQKILSSMKDD